MRLVTLLLVALIWAVGDFIYPFPVQGASFTVNSAAGMVDEAGMLDGDPNDGVCDTGHVHTLQEPGHVHDRTGICTLGAAIEQANTTPAADLIGFNIPGGGPHVIQGSWPAIRRPVTINGFTQPGSRANTNPTSAGINAELKIVLHAIGLVFDPGSAGSAVRDMVISGGGSGILILDSNITVEGSFIGTSSTGTVNLPNEVGIEVRSVSGTRIGGTTPASRNVISGNRSSGVRLRGGQGGTVQGNLIGTDVTGTRALGNGRGVEIDGGFRAIAVIGGADGVTPRGACTGACNVISGNTGEGIIIMDPGTTENRIEGNRIGTDVTGALALGNGTSGIRITMGASTNNITGNVISGNGERGIFIENNIGADSKFNLVRSNLICTNASGSGALPNGVGVEINDASHNTIGGPRDTTPGGACTGDCNLISGNTRQGILITGILSGNNNNFVHGNFIGVDLAGTARLGNGKGIEIVGGRETLVGSTVAANRNIISGNRGDGVLIRGASAQANRVQGNFIGTDTTGAHALGNSSGGGSPAASGVVVTASVNFVGGTEREGISTETLVCTGACNVIAGNEFAGVTISAPPIGGTRPTGVAVRGNFIGTNRAGTLDLGNARAGVLIADSDSNTIGGIEAGAGNLISGNGAGVARGPGTEASLGSGIVISIGRNNRVTKNFIGTDATGTQKIPNDGDGVFLGSVFAADNVIGSVGCSAPCNLISGNAGHGIRIVGASSSGNLILGSNFIGTDRAGTRALGNGGDGVHIERAAGNKVKKSDDLGVPLISGNSGSGVQVTGSTATANRLEGGLIGTNFSGNMPVGNATGVTIRDAPGNTIGVDSSSSIQGNVISGNTGPGVHIVGTKARSNSVLGNTIGSDFAGNVAIPNLKGILIEDAPSNIVGGSVPPQGQDCLPPCNLIRGNIRSGVEILGTNATANLIRGNVIGKSREGQIGNGGNGVSIFGGSDNVVGGDTLFRNVISGNGGSGVLLDAVDRNQVKANFIGANFAGSHRRNNGMDNKFGGVDIAAGNDNIIGGPDVESRNLIVGNGDAGVIIRNNSRANRVEGNRIVANSVAGVAIRNSSANTIGGQHPAILGVFGLLQCKDACNVIVGNDGAGVLITGGDSNRVLGNRIGVDQDESPFGNIDGIRIVDSHSNILGGDGNGINEIAYNSNAGVAVEAITAISNLIVGNHLFDNVRMGIDLGSDGVTPNDLGDTDSGPNDLQNFPELTSARKSAVGHLTRISGRFQGEPNRLYTISFYRIPVCHASGHGEGATFLLSVNLSTDGSGQLTFSVDDVTILAVAPGEFITATATRPSGPAGSTSEFSLCQLVVGSDGVSGGSISGTVTLQGRTAVLPEGVGHSIARVKLDPRGLVTTVGRDGSFTFSNVAPGTDTLTASAQGYVSAERRNVGVASGQNVAAPAVQLRCGLVNNDIDVNINDITATVASFGTSPANRVDAQGRFVDQNGDGFVNINDITCVVSGFGTTSPLPWP
jgi:hypothetical protein